MHILCQVLGICETQSLPMKCGHLTITEGLLVSLEGVSKSLPLQVTVPGSPPQGEENKCPPIPKCITVLKRVPLLPHSTGFYPSCAVLLGGSLALEVEVLGLGLLPGRKWLELSGSECQG